MKKLIFISVFLNSIFVFSQTEKDAILKELRNDTSFSGIIITRPDATKIRVYQLCERWADKVSYLKLNLTESEIAELKSEENASMNIIGLITELEKNNTKEFAINIFNDLIKMNEKNMRYGCSDAISIMPISRYFLLIITKDNPFFKPNFKLTKKEIQEFENKILFAGNNY